MNGKWRVGLEWGSQGHYQAELISGIAEYGRRFGLFHFVTSRGGDFPIRDIEDRNDLNGIIVYREFIEDELRDVQWPADIPIVSVEGVKSQITDWQVRPDDNAVGRMVGEEFLRRGFRRFAYVTEGPVTQLQDWDSLRLQGFTEAVRAVGDEPAVFDTPSNVRVDRYEWSKLLAQWLMELPKPIGIMASKDHWARQLLLAAGATGVAVPEEAAVIGVDNQRWVQITSPSLSSVELDGFQAGYVAMEMLHKRIEGLAAPPVMSLIPPRQLITRRSSDVLAIADSDVATAMRFIADNATAGINVARVVEEVQTSRRLLEYRFRDVLHRTILQEIRSAQIQRAKLLLADPNISLPRVAQLCGFSSAKALSKIFHRVAGATPSAYRNARKAGSNHKT